MWYRILFDKNVGFKRRRDVIFPPERTFWGNLSTQCYRILKLDLINSAYTYTNNFTFSIGFDQTTTDFNTKSSNLQVAVSHIRGVVLVHDKIQANCKET